MQLELSRLGGLGVAAAGFVNWWRSELWGLLPERMRASLTGAGTVIVLAVEDGGLRAFEETSGGRRSAESNVLYPTRMEALEALTRAARANRGAPIVLRIPRAACFSRNVEMPRSAAKDCRRILDLDLERATPFRLKDVYTGYVVEDAAAAPGKVRVLQLVAKRDAIDPIIEEMRRAGLDVAILDCWQGDAFSPMPVNFLQASSAGDTRLITPMRALTALAAGLAVLLGVLTLYKYDTALDAVRTQTAEARTKATTVKRVLDRAEGAVAELDQLRELKARQIPAIEVLEEVTRLLPDSVWLTDLRIDGDVVDMSGLANSGAMLLSLFERSRLFADAALTAPLTFDQREEKERFSLRVRIRQTEMSAKIGGAG